MQIKTWQCVTSDLISNFANLFNFSFDLSSSQCLSVVNPRVVIVGNNVLDYRNVARLFSTFISTRIKTLKPYLRRTRRAISTMAIRRSSSSWKIMFIFLIAWFAYMALFNTNSKRYNYYCYKHRIRLRMKFFALKKYKYWWREIWKFCRHFFYFKHKKCEEA